MQLSAKQKAAFGVGAVGKDMVYALSSSYVMYYYQDLIGLPAAFVGTILMVARVFDAFNDPFMGVIVAKTNTKMGRYRPWLVSGTVLNALVLYLLFAAPDFAGRSLMVYFSVIYILWGVTYTMMDIPYWSMIPAVTDTPKDTENLSVIGRTCAGVGSALIAMGTVLSVNRLGGGNEKLGFGRVALIVAIIFVVSEIVCAVYMRERPCASEKGASIGEMFRALLANDQAMVVVLTIVFINAALYITSNLIIYFFKYDFGGADWSVSYTLFSTVGGGVQILSMMLLYPLLRRFATNRSIFLGCLLTEVAAYVVLLGLCLTGNVGSMALILVPGIMIFGSYGQLSVLTTVFLSNSVDYGELKNGRRDEAVIFSMQTFVVKLASGVSVFIAGLGIQAIGLVGDSSEGAALAQSPETLMGLRLLMSIVPMAVLVLALVFFVRLFKLDDRTVEENAAKLKEMRQ